MRRKSRCTRARAIRDPTASRCTTAENRHPPATSRCRSSPTWVGPATWAAWAATNRDYPKTLVGCYEWQPFNGMFHRNSRVRIAEITDGTSNTVGIGERDDHFVTTNWVGVIPGAEAIYNPQRGLGCNNWRPPLIAVLAHSRQTGANDPTASPGGFQSQHSGGGNFLFMDGSVRFIKASISLPTMWALCTRNNGEVISSDCLLKRQWIGGRLHRPPGMPPRM